MYKITFIQICLFRNKRFRYTQSHNLVSNFDKFIVIFFSYPGEKSKQTFLNLMLEASKHGVELSEVDIIDEVKNFIIAVSTNLHSLCLHTLTFESEYES